MHWSIRIFVQKNYTSHNLSAPKKQEVKKKKMMMKMNAASVKIKVYNIYVLKVWGSFITFCTIY